MSSGHGSGPEVGPFRRAARSVAGGRRGYLWGAVAGVFLYDAYPPNFDAQVEANGLPPTPPAAEAAPSPPQPGMAEVRVLLSEGHVDRGFDTIGELVEGYCPDGYNPQSEAATVNATGSVIRVGETVVLQCVDPL